MLIIHDFINLMLYRKKQIAPRCKAGYNREYEPKTDPPGCILSCHLAGRLCLFEPAEYRGCDRHFCKLMSLDLARIQGLCFDVDGTLADTDDQFVEILAGWLGPVEFLPARLHRKLSGRYFSPERSISKTLARRLVMALETPANWLYGLPDRLHLDRPLQAASEWVRETTAQSSRPKTGFRPPDMIQGVKDMLVQLYPHIPMSVVSARPEKSTLHFLEVHNLTGYFTSIVTAHTCRHTKPYPDPIQWAAKQMGVLPGECLMIGDTTVDIQAGRAAGAQTLGVLCGFGTLDELREDHADEIVLQTSDLLKFFTF
jgi:HAD superfamily hydrolase (TIGR01509 family)